MNADVGIDVYGCMVTAGILNNFLVHYIFGVLLSVSQMSSNITVAQNPPKKLICKMFTVAIDNIVLITNLLKGRFL